jgi:hypothetical protein
MMQKPLRAMDVPGWAGVAILGMGLAELAKVFHAVHSEVKFAAKATISYAPKDIFRFVYVVAHCLARFGGPI